MTGVLGKVGSGRWDAVVVGAGPAGSMAARELARRGRSVLLVEKSEFPRWKVCGACLGRSGVRTLERVGLGGLPGSLGGVAVRRTELLWRSRRVSVPMRGMYSVSRRALDTALVAAARDAGAEVVHGVRASWDEDGAVTLIAGAEEVRLAPRALIIAAGLRAAGGRAEPRIADGSWIGLGAGGPAGDGRFAPETLTMMIGDRGYVGRVVTEDGVADWAAAMDPALIRERGGPAAAVRWLCRDSGLDDAVPADGWTGTPALTRSVGVQHGPGGMICRVGDAAGYVEPITGEGMSWALLGGERLARVLDAALRDGWRGDEWAAAYCGLFRVRRARCRLVAATLRSPALLTAGFGVLGSGGRASGSVVGRLIGAGGGG